MSTKITYRQQYTRCGKQRCRKCREGAGHGPYWYAYWSEKGRTVSKYIGIHLPKDVEEARHPLEDVTAQQASDTPVTIQDTLEPAQGPSLRVYLLGQFRIERQSEGEWRAIDSRTWNRRRARALLGCLLSNPGRRLGREQVMELLWPDLDIDVAANRLNGAVHELRQILEPEIARPAASRMLRLEHDVLELADSSHIWVDAEAFEDLIKEADITFDTEQREQLLEEAAALYGGNYLLEELYSEWAAPRRDVLQRAWVGLLLHLADARAEHGAFVSAIEAIDRLRTADPTNETALQRLMLILTRLDRRGEALQIYRQHVAQLQRDYECEPLPETTTLYETLRKGQAPTPTFRMSPRSTTRTQPLSEDADLASDEVDETLVVPDIADLPAPVEPEVKKEIIFTRPIFQLGRHNQSPLTGRERELATMHQLLLTLEGITGREDTIRSADEIRNGPHRPVPISSSRPRLVHFLLLKGDAGIGKTRLAEELSHKAYTRGWAVVWSRSYEQEGAIPYRPWTELLRTLLHNVSTFAELVHLVAPPGTTDTPGTSSPSSLKLERLSTLLPELSTAIPPKPSLTVAHEQERLNLWEAALGLLGALSKRHPLLLVLDDLHWADDSSVELLTYLAHHLQDQRILLVGTCREAELTPHHKLRTLITDLQRYQSVVPISLQPLTQVQIGTLLSHLPQEKVQSIQAQAAGNPFFAEELARYEGTIYNEEEQVARVSQTEPLENSPRLRPVPSAHHKLEYPIANTNHALPDAIAAVLERRLGRLSSDCQILLGKAAVLGGSFELGQLLPMASEHNEDTVLDLLDEALQAGLLTEEGTGAHITYHFWHPLIISHLYTRLSAGRRAQLHRRAAEAIKTVHPTEEVAAAIVYHLGKGGGDPAAIAHYANLAGNQAYDLAAYSEAQQYYLQVLGALAGDHAQKPEGDDVRTYLLHITAQKIIRISQHNLLHICQLLEHIAECSMVLGNFEEARHVYTCILDVRNNEIFRQQIHAANSIHSVNAADATEYNEKIQKQEAQFQALIWREIEITWKTTGDYERAYECLGRGKEVLLHAHVSSGKAWACLHLQYGVMFRLEGNYHEARRYFQEALEMLEQEMQQTAMTTQDTGTQKATAPLPSPIPAEIPGRTPNLFQARTTRTERSLVGNLQEIGYAHEMLGVAIASMGQINDGLKHMHIALKMYEQNDLVTEMTRVCSNLGAAYITRGEHDTARRYMYYSLDLAERAGNQPSMSLAMINLANVVQRSGDLVEAEGWFTQSLTLAERVNNRERMSWCNVELAAVQEDLGKLHEAAASIRRAINIGREIKSTRCIRYALVGLAELRIAQVMSTCQFPLFESGTTPLPTQCQRLLLRTKSTLHRAITLEGLEAEYIIDGKYLLAQAHFLLGQLEAAKQIAYNTLKEAQEQETVMTIGRSYRLLGIILAAQGEYTQAEQYFRQAIETCSEFGLRLDYARALHGQGITLLYRSRVTDTQSLWLDQQVREEMQQRGRTYLHQAYAIFHFCHAVSDRVRVERDLTLFETQEKTTDRLQHLGSVSVDTPTTYYIS